MIGLSLTIDLTGGSGGALGARDDGIRDLVIMYGDSNKLGQANDQASLVYAADPLTRVQNGSNAFVQYAPVSPFNGTTGVTGRAFGSNRGTTGFEYRFAQRYRVDNPGKELFLMSDAAPGGCQGRNLAGAVGTGVFSGTVSNDRVLKTGNVSGGVFVGYAYISGGSIPAGTYAAYSTGTANEYFLESLVGSLGAIGSISFREPGYSFEVGDGKNSYATSKVRIPNAISAIQGLGFTPRLTFVVQLGVNDSQNGTLAAAYDAAAEAFYADLRLRPGVTAQTKIIQVRPTYAGYADLTTVRTAMAANAAAAADVYLANIDGAGNNGGGDTIHHNLAGLASIGDTVYDIFSGASAGV